MPPKKADPPQTPTVIVPATTSSLIWTVILAVIIAGATYYFQQAYLRSVAFDISGQKFAIERPILRQSWADEKPFAKKLARKREPVILRDTFVNSWKAMHWTPENLKIKTLYNAKNGTNKVFVPVSPKEGLLSIGLRSTFRIQNITKADFLARQGAPAEYHYYSGVLADWGDHIMKDIEPYSELLLDPERGVPTVWFGHAGVTANLHHDRSENWFVQVHGKKRWIMFPPTEWANLYLYPQLHRHYHQSQVDLTDPDYARFPALSRAIGYDAILEPGDVMYVPPYWFHFVEGQDTAISLAFLSPSSEEQIWSQLQQLPRPFDADWHLSERTAATVSYLRLLIDALYGEESADNFVTRVLKQSRYVHFLAPLLQQAPDASVFALTRCFANETTLSFDDVDAAPPTLVKLVNAGVQAASRLPVGVREIQLGNLVEVLARDAVGLDNVAALLQYCFVEKQAVQAK